MLYIYVIYIYVCYIYKYVIYIYYIYICYIYICYIYMLYIYVIYICYIYMLYYIYIVYIYICYIYIYICYIYIICCIPSEVIKKKRINLLMPLSPYRFFSSLSFCRLSALITIKEVYAHAAAIQKIIRSASIDLGHSYLCCKNASWSKLTVATCSHNVFRRGPFFKCL